MTDFRKVTQDFCNHYYSTWNSNPNMLKDLYEDPRITYLNKEFGSFDSYFYYLKTYVNKMEFLNYQWVSQPLGKYHILINVSGSINLNHIVKKFNETIVLHKNLWEKYHIVNTILRLE